MKLNEIDKEQKKGDFLRTELMKMTETYNFDKLDEEKEALTNYRKWAQGMLFAASRVAPLVESYFKCGLCRNMAIEAVIFEPCNHVFCKKCLAA